MLSRSPSTKALAMEAWHAIFDFIVRTADHRTAALANLGLTPNDSRALMSLDPETGRTMRSLAIEWNCDASTATWIVDRLESRGYVERRSHATDRRVKLVVLTPAGVAVRDRMVERMYTPPPELLDLDPAELVALRDAARALPGPGSRDPSS
jgi:DNA-binding MarR family transcriptional regulator